MLKETTWHQICWVCEKKCNTQFVLSIHHYEITMQAIDDDDVGMSVSLSNTWIVN